MNNGVHDFSPISRKHLMNLFLIVPLLLAALFAYQAGNMFELTAGASRITAAAKYATSTVRKQSTTATTFLPENALVAAYMHALMLIYWRSTTLSALVTTYRQRLRDLLMTPIKFTSHFVG
ncbi:hypothetical protein BK120_15655 [Paenibacillus sp. FSL A5-0031]|uniref:hypothetical protein n=1 Tax=Paenibacillus sp. FSL A5-0031 TaxID=1920420 RepID=UPI00096FB497|nr:hypothetical protein [Paenibacillus sp. FSL A5-0031]OME82111.1 hypothetical protein BK120_15655 [Paenibacillus sp. FSL A5-0031]